MKRKILLGVLIVVFCLSLVLAACQDNKQYTATFVVNGGSAVENKTVSQLETAPSTTRSGFTFMGWYLTSDFSDGGISYPYKLTKDTTFYAKWEAVAAVEYIVAFETNGGSTIAMRSYSVIETSPVTTRSGYTFVGWYDNIELEGNPITFPYTPTKTTVLYAKWVKDAAEKFMVNFNTNGGEFLEAQMTSEIAEMPVTTRDGYVLEGWYDNKQFDGDPIAFPYEVTANVTLHAKWTEVIPDTYIVTYHTNGGSAVATYQGTSIATSPSTTRQGNYRFVGWFDNSECSGNPVTFPYALTKNTDLYAKWEATGFTLTFNTMGGSSILEKSNVLTVKEADIAKPTNGDKEFDGWYLDEACSQKVSFPYTLAKNTTFYAKWKDKDVVTFTVHFIDGGEVLSVNATYNGKTDALTTTIDSSSSDFRRGKPFVTVNDGSVITLPVPVRENAEFLGWTTTEHSENYVASPMTVVGNTVLYAHWRVNVTPNPDDSAVLQTYLDKASNNADTFVAGYGLLVQNTTGTVSQTFQEYHYRPDKIATRVYEYDYNAPSTTRPGESGAFVPAYLDFAFLRNDNDSYWMVYTDTGDGSGTYQYGGLWFNAEAVTNIEEACYMVYLTNLSRLDSSQFYKYDGKWYATADYVDEAGKLLLGNASGDPSLYSITYNELALTFNADGVITDIDVKSNVIDSYSIGTGTAVTNYYYTHDINFWTFDVEEVLNVSESQFLQDQVRPSGLYPELNPDDAKRNNVVSDGVAYTTEQLQTALSSMTNFTSYYTLAGRTFSGFMYTPATVTVHGDYGTVKYDAYDAYTWGEFTSAAQEARDAWYFKFNQDAFFLAINGTNGYSVYCDRFSYKNNYYYNQYLLGTQAAIGFNCKYPAGLKYLNASDFTYVSTGGYFEFNGSDEQLKAAGQMLFGDMDFVYPEAGETENYVYLRLYMNDGKLVKVLAATRLDLFGESSEYFVKELVITSYESPSVTMPIAAEEQCVIPGEAKSNGSVAGLQTAINTTKGKNHKYTDKFAYDDDDELGGIGFYGSESSGDIYIHYNGITRVNNNLFLYFKDGKLNQQRAGSAAADEITLADFNGDVEKANSYVLWAYSMSELLNADWFYQGVNGNYYGKSEYMDKLSWAIGRFSGSEQMLEYDANTSFGIGYRWTVELDFVEVVADSYGLQSIYYSGAIHVKGSGGEHFKPFSGYAAFSYDGTSVTLPVSAAPDTTRPTVYQYINANYSFNVDNQGILSIDAVEHALGYKAYVYMLNGNDLVAEFEATNGMDLKTVTELNAGTDVKNYRIAIKALGGDSNEVDGVIYLDGVESQTAVFELSTLPKLTKPTVSLDSNTATVTVSGDYPDGTYYHYEISQGGTVIAQGNKLLSDPLNLNNLGNVTLTPVKTHVIAINIMGESGEIRDSEVVTVSYTVPKSDGTSFLSDLFAAIDYSKSFSVSLSAQDRYRYHYFNRQIDGIELMDASYTWLNQNRDYTLNMDMYFELSLNQGKLTFYMADASYKHLYDVTFRFHKVGDQLTGQFVKTVGDNVVESKTLTTGLMFAGVSALEDGFTELSGEIDKFPHLAYRYTDDITSADTQSAINDLFILEELLGEQLTYTAMQLNMGYGSNGALSSNSCSLALAADTENGHSLIVSFCFSRFGENLTRWVKD